MRLTLRDGATTVLAAFAILVTLAVTQAWSWPLLGGYRAGVIALTIIGLGMCTVGGVGSKAPSAPFVAIVSLLGVAALTLIIVGLIVGTEALFVALAAVLVAMWFVTTVDHALPGTPGQPVQTGA